VKSKALRKAQADLDFLAKVRSADVDTLRVMQANHASKRAPRWKQIAIERAIKRQEKKGS
jgi:hypothetical protein